MNDLSDRDLIRIRLRQLDLLKSFFDEAPDAEKLSRWRGTFSSLASETVSPRLDGAVRRLNELLGSMTLKQIQEEFYVLFVDPFSESSLNTRASYHIDGRNNGPSLVRFRQLLIDAGLRRQEEVMEDEDSMLIMLDFLVTLIEEEKKGDVENREHQHTLLTAFLEPTASAMLGKSRDNQAAVFYGACLEFLNGYLELEDNLLDIR